MFRTLARTACILLLAGTVAGALYLLVGPGGPSVPGELRRTPDTSSFDGRFGHGRGARREDRPTAHGDRRGREEASFGHGIAGMLGTAVQVGLVGAVVVGLRKRSRRSARHRKGEGR